MGLYIRDDRVRDMAKRLAEARRTTVTDAVRQAIERELAAVEQDLRAREWRLERRAGSAGCPAPAERDVRP
jgi:hypothetical protein